MIRNPPNARRFRRLFQGGAVACLLGAAGHTAGGAPAVLAQGASFEVQEGISLVGHRRYPIGTRVDAVPAANGLVKVTTEDGATALVPAAGVIYGPKPTPVPTVRPGSAAPRVESTDDGAADLTTLSGKTYKQAVVFRVEPDGINYMFAGGMVKVPFGDLPEEVRKQFAYDPKKAAAFAAQDAAEQQRYVAQAKAQVEAARLKEQAAEAAQAAADKARAEHDRLAK